MTISADSHVIGVCPNARTRLAGHIGADLRGTLKRTGTTDAMRNHRMLPDLFDFRQWTAPRERLIETD